MPEKLPEWLKVKPGPYSKVVRVVLQGTGYPEPADFIKENPRLMIGKTDKKKGVPAIKIFKDLRGQAKRKLTRSERAQLMHKAADFVAAVEAEGSVTLNHTAVGIARVLDRKKYRYFAPNMSPAHKFLEGHGLMKTPMKQVGNVRGTKVAELQPRGEWKNVRSGPAEASFVNLPVKSHPKTRIGHPHVARLVAAVEFFGNLTEDKKKPGIFSLQLRSKEVSNSQYFIKNIGGIIEQLSGKVPRVEYVSDVIHGYRRNSLLTLITSKTLSSLLMKELGYTDKFPRSVRKELLEVPEFRRAALQVTFDSLASPFFSKRKTRKYSERVMRVFTRSKDRMNFLVKMFKKEGVSATGHPTEADTGASYPVEVSIRHLSRLFDKVKPQSPYQVAKLAVLMSTNHVYEDYALLHYRVKQLLDDGTLQKKCAWIVPHVYRTMPELKSEEHLPPVGFQLHIWEKIPKEGITVKEIVKPFSIRKETMQRHLRIMLENGFVARRKHGFTYTYYKAEDAPPDVKKHEKALPFITSRGITATELGKKMSISRSYAGEFLQALHNDGRVERKGIRARSHLYFKKRGRPKKAR